MTSRGGPHRRGLAATAVAGAVLTALAGCGAASPTAGSSTVVASFYPWAWLSHQIGGDMTSVQNLTGSGVEPHDLELTPRQVVDVKQALLVVYVKGMQPAVDDAVEQHADDHALDAGSVVDALPAGLGSDPHIWLDPVRFAAVAKELGNRLAQVDPAHAEEYLHRTERLVRALGELHEAYRSGLRTCRSRTLVTSHASFGYLADRYGLEQVGIAGLDPHVPPSPAHLAKVARLIEAEDVEVVFLERPASPRAATSLAREVGARTAVLDPIEGVRPDSQDYLSLMRGNLSILREALGCS